MDWSSEKYPWLSLLLGFALMFVWGVMSLANAYGRGLAKVDDSFIQDFMVVEQLDAIADTLTRVSVDQEAFLSTGDRRFQDGVIESAETFALDMHMLNALAARTKLQRPLLNGLSRSIDQVLGSVADSDEIREARGRVAAVAFFESKEPAISDAKSQAERLRIEITGCILDRIRSARGTSALFEAFLYGAPAGSGLVHKQPLPALKQETRHSVIGASTDQFTMEVSH